MTTRNLSPNARGVRALNPIVFTVFDDTANNPRPGLGLEQLSDPQVPVAMIAELSTDVAVGDTVTLYWDDAAQQTFDVTQAVIDTGQLSFSVEADQVVEPSGTVYYTVNTAGGLLTSPERTVVVKKTRPGPTPPDPDSDTNDSLPLPSLSPTPVNLDNRESLKVTVQNWDNIEIGDHWIVLANGLFVASAKVSQTDSGVQTNTCTFRQDRVADDKLPVTYEIRDKVGNYSRFSPVEWAQLYRLSGRIAPVLQECDPETLVLDLDALNGADVHLIVPKDSGVRTGDDYTVTLQGEYYGQPILVKAFTHTVEDSKLDPVATFVVPNAELQKLAGGNANLSYVSVNTTGVRYTSKNACIRISGQWPGLPAPVVQHAVEGVIDLGRTLDPTLQVTVPLYQGKYNGDYIRLFCIGTPPTLPAAHFLADHTVAGAEAQEPLVVNVDRAHLVPLIEGQWRLCYQVTYNQASASQPSKQMKFSLPATFRVIETEIVEDDFTDQPEGLIQAGASVETSALTITFVSGAGNAGFPGNDKLPEDAGPLKLPVLHVCFQNPVLNPGTQVLEVDLKREFKKVQCDVHGSNGKTKVEVLDTGKNVLATINVPDQVNYLLSHSGTKPEVRYLRITCDKDWTRWDNFVMER